MSASVEGPPLHAAITQNAKEVSDVRRKLEKSYRRSESLLVNLLQCVDGSSKAATAANGKLLVEKYTATLKSARIERNNLRKREAQLMQELFKMHGVNLDVSQLFSPVPASPMLDRSLMRGMSPVRTSGQFLHVPMNASFEKGTPGDASAEDERRVLLRLKRHLIAQISQFEQFRRSAESAALKAEADQTLETLRKDLQSIEHELSLLPDASAIMRGAYSPMRCSPMLPSPDARAPNPLGLGPGTPSGWALAIAGTATRPPRPPSPQHTVVGRLAAASASASIASPILPKKLNFSSAPEPSPGHSAALATPPSHPAQHSPAAASAAAAAAVAAAGGAHVLPAPAFRVDPSTPPKDEAAGDTASAAPPSPSPAPPPRAESPEPSPSRGSAPPSRLCRLRRLAAAARRVGPGPGPARPGRLARGFFPLPPPPPPAPPAAIQATPPRPRTPLLSARSTGSEAPPPSSPALFAPLSPIACPSPQPTARSDGHRSARSNRSGGGASAASGSRRGSIAGSCTGGGGGAGPAEGPPEASPSASVDGSVLGSSGDGSLCLSPDVRQLKLLVDRLSEELEASMDDSVSVGSPAVSPAPPAAPPPAPPVSAPALVAAARPRAPTRRLGLGPHGARRGARAREDAAGAGPAPAEPQLEPLPLGLVPSPPGNHVGLRASLKLAIPGRSRPAPPSPTAGPPRPRLSPSPRPRAVPGGGGRRRRGPRTAGPSSARVVICAPGGPRTRAPAAEPPPPAAPSLLRGGARRVPLSEVPPVPDLDVDDPLADDGEEVEEDEPAAIASEIEGGAWWEDSDDSEDEYSRSAPA
eukprot:tig00020849_g14636.t1